jgi:hypothetical protein
MEERIEDNYLYLSTEQDIEDLEKPIKSSIEPL